MMRFGVAPVVFAGAALLLATSSAIAQESPQSPSDPPNPSGTTSPNPGSTVRPPTSGDGLRRPSGGEPAAGDDQNDESWSDEKPASGWSATVRVENGITGDPVPNAGLLLMASRPVGPFERRSPEPRELADATTNRNGVAELSKLPKEVISKNLEVYAVTTASGIEFESSRKPAKDGVRLELAQYPRASDAEDVVVEHLRTIFQPWEDFLVVSQRWRLAVRGNRAVDTTTLPGDRFEKGLPLELPLEAEGIHLFGAGDSEIVDNTAHWKGVIRPGETVSLRLRFSVSANSPTHVYRQSVDYPVDDVEVVLPLQSKHEKVSRLDRATLAAKGFESVEATRRVPGLRSDNEYLYASGQSLKPGETFAVRMTGLPFDRPVAPWVALGLGLLGVGLVLGLARREVARRTQDDSTGNAVEVLEREREDLLDELADLERAFEEDDVSEITYETESLRLRERLSLVMKKIDELREDA